MALKLYHEMTHEMTACCRTVVSVVAHVKLVGVVAKNPEFC
jgi:hypothetical protein